jgi:transposase
VWLHRLFEQHRWGRKVDACVKQYSAAFKARVVRRLVGPQAVSANRLSAEVGVSQVSLSRWLSEARSVEGMPKRDAKKWTGAEKLRVVLAAEGLSDIDLGALLRREGLHAAQLIEWRGAAEAALGPPARVVRTEEAARIQELERELRRKDRALAETAALLVLKKKVRAIWGDADDTTDPRNAR